MEGEEMVLCAMQVCVWFCCEIFPSEGYGAPVTCTRTNPGTHHFYTAVVLLESREILYTYCRPKMPASQVFLLQIDCRESIYYDHRA